MKTIDADIFRAARKVMEGAVKVSSETQFKGREESGRLYQLLGKLEKLLAEKYAFDVFAKDSINFGIMVTYRQTWQPQNYQVGDLVKTIPLGAKETTRYTTRTVNKKTRTQKELEDNLQNRKSESSDTLRADAEIVKKAQNKNSFTVTAHEALDIEGVTISSTQTATQDQAKQSESAKKDFRESVLKSAQEYKQQHRIEIETNQTEETEATTTHELQNPNDELTVTYLFYELQRTYKISEKLHKLTPVILVAYDVPPPHEINDVWLMKNDWILRRVILDDSFRPALDYLTKSLVGAEVNIRILEGNALGQKEVVDSIRQQIRSQSQLLTREQQSLLDAVRSLGQSERQEALLGTIKRTFFDPIGLTGETDTGAVDAAQAMVDYTKETLDRAEREKARLLSQLEVAMTALQAAVDKLSHAVKDHYDKVTEIDRLRIHVKENILYYMQAIWSHEPPDQRFFRLYNLDVPIVMARTAGVRVNLYSENSKLAHVLESAPTVSGKLPMPEVTFSTKKLVEVADLDTVLGYKGNYAIFPLKENNYITLHMMQDYLDVGEEILIRDPDEFGNYSVEQLQAIATCMHRKDPELFKRYRDRFKQLLIDRLTSNKDNDLVVVPTTSLYIAALVDTHPLLEDFKLIHRALDVKKVQAEVRHAELENIRLASRALKGKDEDPDIEKKIIIQNGKEFVIDTE